MMRNLRFLSLLVFAALAACDGPDSDHPFATAMPPDGPPLQARQTMSRLALTLPRDGDMTGAEWQKFDVFLSAAANGKPEAVHMVITGDPSPKVRNALIRGAMERGVELNKIELAPPAPANGVRVMHVELIAKTYTAVMPNCPNQERLDTIGNDNRVSSDWGCSTASNLSLQVADPRDLVEGESGGATDAALTTAAIVRLQTDKVKKLDTTSFGLLGQ